MNTLQEAAKLAIEALEIVKLHYTQNRHVNDAINALNAALVQQGANTAGVNFY